MAENKNFAKIPDYIPTKHNCPMNYNEPTYDHNDDQLIWLPNIVNDNDLDEFIRLARKINGWNDQQSYSFLHAFDYNVNVAMKNLSKFRTNHAKRSLDRCQQVYLQRIINDDNRMTRFPNQFELAKIFLTGHNDDDDRLIRMDIINEILRSEVEKDDER